jgi:MFS family permease
MQRIAQSWLVLQMTGSGTTLGIVAAFQYLPMLLFGPYSGVLIDRFPRRKIIYLTQAISGLLALILGILVLTGLIKVWMIYILALFLGLINTIDIPAGQNFSLEMVGEEKLQNAVSLDATLKSLARAVGPAIAGALLLTLGVGLCFIVNAISYIAVLIALFMMR